jgi:hypothetical protein
MSGIGLGLERGLTIGYCVRRAVRAGRHGFGIDRVTCLVYQTSRAQGSTPLRSHLHHVLGYLNAHVVNSPPNNKEKVPTWVTYAILSRNGRLIFWTNTGSCPREYKVVRI